MTVKAYEGDDPPPAVVMMWTGSISNIPAGWALCDGNNGTPDLSNKMIRGNASMHHDPGETGGQNTLALEERHLPPHDHSMSTNTAGAHSHQVGDACCANDYDLGSIRMNSNGTEQISTADGGSHTHNVGVSKAGSGASIDNRPAFYSVAFITKL